MKNSTAAAAPAPSKYGFIHWPDQTYRINKIPFLSYQPEGGELSLVTVNGGLIPISSIESKLQSHLRRGLRLTDFKCDAPQQYLPNTEHLRKAGITNVDGFPVEGESAQLLCLDMNILTGLRSKSHNEVKALIESIKGKDCSLFKLAGNEKLKKEIFEKIDADATDPDTAQRLKRGVEIAYNHVTLIDRKLNGLMAETMAEAALVGDAVHDNASKPQKTPGQFLAKARSQKDPKFFMSMGGPSAGKHFAGVMTEAHCGNDYVRASLDKFREFSGLYDVIRATNHHSDDYVVVEPFAKELRARVMKAAMKKKVNIIYDCSGIPFKDESRPTDYAKIVNDFKDAKYHTEVVALDTAMDVAVKRMIFRFNDRKRAMPWKPFMEKYMGAPASFLQAAQEPALDKISLWANDYPSESTHAPDTVKSRYIVAETLVLKDEEVVELATRKEKGKLAKYLKKHFLVGKDEDGNPASALYHLSSEHNLAREEEENKAAKKTKDTEKTTKTDVVKPAESEVSIPGKRPKLPKIFFKMADYIQGIPGFAEAKDDQNVDYKVFKTDDGTNHVLVIYDVARLKKFAEKATTLQSMYKESLKYSPPAAARSR